MKLPEKQRFPVGAGAERMWGGDACVAREWGASFRSWEQDAGGHKGPHLSSTPPPPLRDP